MSKRRGGFEAPGQGRLPNMVVVNVCVCVGGGGGGGSVVR